MKKIHLQFSAKKILYIPLAFIIFGFLTLMWDYPKYKTQNGMEYAWLINKKHLKDTVQFTTGKIIRKKFIKQNYRFKRLDYYVQIFEYSKIKNIELNNITFKQNVELNNLNPWVKRIYDNSYNDPTSIIFGLNLDLSPPIKVSFDNLSSINQNITKDNYIAYYGKFNKILLSNKQDSAELLYDFEHKKIEKTLILFLKKRGRFFIIITNSDKDFSMTSALDLFNLE